MDPLKTLNFEPAKHNQHTLFAPARLMSPAEVKNAIRDRDAREIDSIGARWMICGDIKASTFDALKARGSSPIPFRLSAFKSTFGNAYVVMTHQVDNHQHRFVLSLQDPDVRSFIDAAARQPHGFMLGRAGGRDALVIPGLSGPAAFSPLRALFTAADEGDAARCLAELPIVMTTLGRCDAIPSFESGHTVSEVSVSVLVPLTIVDDVPASQHRH